jgi:hypothetical protein
MGDTTANAASLGLIRIQAKTIALQSMGNFLSIRRKFFWGKPAKNRVGLQTFV